MIKRLFTSHSRSMRILSACVVASIIGAATPILTKPTTPTSAALTNNSTSPVENQPTNGPLRKGTPEYDTVLPKGKTIQDYGGWTRVSPPNRDPVYAYVDKIDAVPINVSQQPLPKDFADQTSEQIELLARGYAANKELKVNDSIVYIGTSAKGPQSLIVVKNDLLILIKASAAVSDDKWKSYIQSLS